MSRNHNRIASLAVLAMLTFVLTNLQAQNPVANTAAPAVAASGPGSALTPEVMNKMPQAIALRGSDVVLPAPYANALGLSATGQSWPDQQIAVGATLDNFKHGFCVSRRSEQ